MENKVMRFIGLAMVSTAVYRITNDIWITTIFITGMALSFHGAMFSDNQKGLSNNTNI